ncbi:MAG: glycosyltransferase family 4 protein [Bryobacterales bacterium]|nr:glycosyltransferase family 4 protein [Bryobacterales bacterium]
MRPDRQSQSRHTRLRVFTWHVHGSYLYYLAQAPHDFIVPVKPGRPEGYGGRCGTLPWPSNLLEAPAQEVRNLEFDCILFQARRNYLEDQYEILSAAQRRLPRIFLEHDPPREHPTDTRHVVDDPELLLVHVTPFNELMWDSGRTPTRVIDHGVTVPAGVRYGGELERGLVVVNGLASRGRRCGADLFERTRKEVPLDLVGMDSAGLGGLGEIRHHQLPAFAARYRFFFNPIRYTSMGLAVCEAMMLGMPVVGLATTEMAAAVENGVSGYVDTCLETLIGRMRHLLASPAEARRLGEGARRRALQRFHIDRFIRDWDETLHSVSTAKPAIRSASAEGTLGEQTA